jgi:hypothetical protein
VNGLIDWIDPRPGPAWVYCSAGVLLLGIAIEFGQVLTGSRLRTMGGTGALAYSFYPIYFVALLHCLHRQASQALERFCPALAMGDAEYAQTEYRQTKVPAGGAWIATVLGIPLVFVFVLGGENAPTSAGRPPLVALSVAVTVFTVACLLALALRSVRQLRQVGLLHHAATTINLFQPRPTFC